MNPGDAEAQRMARALALAERGRCTSHPNPRVGCVIVKAGKLIGEGFHLRAGEAHAEVAALRMAGAAARGADLFVNLEPCAHHGRTPPCVDALIAAGVKRVWTAMSDPNPLVAGRGIERLREAGIEVHVGLMQAAAERLNRGFISRMRRKRPFVTLKLAASLDGRTATARGESRWITGAAARADVHRLRAETGAVLTSSQTVLADDPELSVRDWPPQSGEAAPTKLAPATPSLASPEAGNPAIQGRLSDPRQPDRIVLDSEGRVPTTAKVWAAGARRFWITAPQNLYALSMGTVNAKNNIVVLAVEGDANGSLNLERVLEVLAAHEINELLVECGPKLAGAFLAARLVDELVIYLAPSLLGHEGRALAEIPGLERLDQRLGLVIQDACLVGSDLRITAGPRVC